MTTIIDAHPWKGSFNKAILDTVAQTLDQRQKPHSIIDLHQDGFNPVMGQPNLAL